MQHHELAASGALYGGQYVEPVIAHGIDVILRPDDAHLRHRAAVAPEEIAKHGELSAQRTLVDLAHFDVIREGDGAGKLVFLDDFLECVATEEIQLVTRPRRAIGEFEEMDIAARDAGGEDAVGDEMKTHWKAQRLKAQSSKEAPISNAS